MDNQQAGIANELGFQPREKSKQLRNDYIFTVQHIFMTLILLNWSWPFHSNYLTTITKLQRLNK